jgi:hypothetical protein
MPIDKNMLLKLVQKITEEYLDDGKLTAHEIREIVVSTIINQSMAENNITEKETFSTLVPEIFDSVFPIDENGNFTKNFCSIICNKIIRVFSGIFKYKTN